MNKLQQAFARLQQAMRGATADIHNTIFDIERGAEPSETRARLQLFAEQINDRLTSRANQLWLLLVEQQQTIDTMADHELMVQAGLDRITARFGEEAHEAFSAGCDAYLEQQRRPRRITKLELHFQNGSKIESVDLDHQAISLNFEAFTSTTTGTFPT